MNSRRKGITWELKVREEFLRLFPDVITTRAGGKNLDDIGIDLFDPTGKMPFYIQVKATKQPINLEKTLEDNISLIKESNLAQYKPLILVKVYFPTKVSGKKRTRRNDSDIIVFTRIDCYRDIFKSLRCYTDERLLLHEQLKHFSRGWRNKLLSRDIIYRDTYILTTLKRFINYIEKCLI